MFKRILTICAMPWRRVQREPRLGFRLPWRKAIRSPPVPCIRPRRRPIRPAAILSMNAAPPARRISTRWMTMTRRRTRRVPPPCRPPVRCFRRPTRAMAGRTAGRFTPTAPPARSCRHQIHATAAPMDRRRSSIRTAPPVRRNRPIRIAAMMIRARCARREPSAASRKALIHKALPERCSPALRRGPMAVRSSCRHCRPRNSPKSVRHNCRRTCASRKWPTPPRNRRERWLSIPPTPTSITSWGTGARSAMASASAATASPGTGCRRSRARPNGRIGIRLPR